MNIAQWTLWKTLPVTSVPLTQSSMYTPIEPMPTPPVSWMKLPTIRFPRNE